MGFLANPVLRVQNCLMPGGIRGEMSATFSTSAAVRTKGKGPQGAVCCNHHGEWITLVPSQAGVLKVRHRVEQHLCRWTQTMAREFDVIYKGTQQCAGFWQPCWSWIRVALREDRTWAKPVASTMPAPKQRAMKSRLGYRPRLSSGRDTPMADVARIANSPAMRSSWPAVLSASALPLQPCCSELRADMAVPAASRTGFHGWPDYSAAATVEMSTGCGAAAVVLMGRAGLQPYSRCFSCNL